MAQKYYNVKETASVFGVTEDDIKKMLERRELYGYRDGPEWKFKVEDIDRMAKDRQSQTPILEEEDDSADVLLSEVELGQSEIAASGTVLGMEHSPRASSESGLRLLDSGINLAQDLKPEQSLAKDSVDSKVSQFEDLDLTLDEDVTLDDSVVGSGKGNAISDLDLGGSSRKHNDADLVLGGSGAGSDVTIGGDSGISLVDPSDSGISLESPSGRGDDESLALGEEDLLTTGGSVKTGVRKRLKTDDEFLLTPLEDASDTEESESGSQVIALDTEGDESATMISSGGRSRINMMADADEDLLGHPRSGPGPMGDGVPFSTPTTPGMQPTPMTGGVPLIQPAATLPEAPYTGWQVTSLVVCSLFLMVCGIVAYDLMRNMWSWNGPFKVNSSLMDFILGLFE